MPDSTDSGRPSRPSAILWQLTLTLCLTLVLAACGPKPAGPTPGGPQEPGPAQPLTQDEFFEFAAQLNEELTKVVQDVTITSAMQVAFSAIANSVFPNPDMHIGSLQGSDAVLLPRGKWSALVDDYGWVTGWDYEGDLEGGLLEFTSSVVIYDEATDVEAVEPVEYKVDWELGGTATVFHEYNGELTEMPRNVSAEVTTDGETVVSLTASADPSVITVGCTFDIPEYDYAYDMIIVTELLLNGTLGSKASGLFLEAVDLSLELDEESGNYASSGAVSAHVASHELAASWNAALTTDSTPEQVYNDYLYGCGNDLDMPEAAFTFDVELTINEFELGLQLEVETLGGSADVDLALSVTVNGAAAFQLTASLDPAAELDGQLQDVLVHFEDSTLSLADFIESLDGIFGQIVEF